MKTMKTLINKLRQSSFAILASLVVLSSCKKDFSGNPSTPNSMSMSGNIPAFMPLGVALNGFGNYPADSIYVIYPCERDLVRDAIPASALPISIQDYQTDNYAAFNQQDAYTISDTEGNLKAYISIIRFNNKPVALEFSMDGSFKKVLEQREWADLDNDGWHTGGLFEDRDGTYSDNIEPYTLPDEIKNYLSVNFPEDSLLKAFRTKEDAYLVITKNNGGYAHVFNGNLEPQKYLALCGSNCQLEDIEKSNLSSTIQNRLSNTFPNYVFNKSDLMTVNNSNLGTLVLINANNTRYAVTFNNNGDMISKKAIY
jgi:hypothetical protein